MIGMYQYKNIYDKMLDVQNLEGQEKVDCIVDNYKTDVDWKWLIDLMSTKPDYKIDYTEEIEKKGDIILYVFVSATNKL